MDTATKPKLIKTEHVFPPIPTRGSDWCAWFDGEEELGGYGWGATEREAIESLKEARGICLHCDRHEGDVKTCGVGGCPLGADL